VQGDRQIWPFPQYSLGSHGKIKDVQLSHGQIEDAQLSHGQIEDAQF
jgi:hypothetical protein